MKCVWFGVALLSSLNILASVSNDLKSLENNNTSRLEWVNSKNSLLNSRYNKIANKKVIEEELKTIDSRPWSYFRSTLKNSQIIEVTQTGFGKEFFINKNGKKIFGSSQINKNGYFQFNNLVISPTEKYLLVNMYEKGNTEDFQMLILDIETGEQILQRKLYSGVDSCFFISEDECYLNSPDARGGEQVLVKYNFKDRTSSLVNEFDEFSENDNFAIAKKKDNYFLIDHKNNYFKYDNQSISERDVFAFNDNYIYQAYQQLNENREHELTIEKVLMSKDEMPKTIELFKVTNEVKGQIVFFENTIGFITSFGLDRKIRVLDLEGKVLMEKNLPFNYRYSLSKVDLTKRAIELTISASDQRETKIFSFDDEDLLPTKNLWLFNGLQLEVKNYFAISADGTKVPYQTIGVVDHSNLPRHAFMQTYGGFNVTGYLFSYRGLEQYYPFLKRGGIIVNTGVRGGSEYGLKWYMAARKENKMKTFEDNAAIAKNLIENGLSKKEWITLTGSSNGGYVSATTGLLFSENFGLVIPHAGVLDQLAKKRLDSEYNGWVREYLDEEIEVEREKIPSISPVELAANPVKINYLIFTEQNDTRVNPVHSYKFYSELSKNNLGETYLYAMKNYGHYSQGYPTGYLASWRYWSIVWNFIFDSQK